jgi:hypothetical protein
LPVLFLIDGVHRLVDAFARDALEAQLVGNFHSPSPVEIETVVDKGPSKSLLIDETLTDELVEHLPGLDGIETPLRQFLADVGGSLLAAGAQGCSTVHRLSHSEGLSGIIH